MDDNNKKKKVLSPISKEGKTHWVRLGTAFQNRDGSYNVYLDGLPTNGKLQIRDWDEAPWEKKDAGQQNLAMPALAGVPNLMAVESRTDDLPF